MKVGVMYGNPETTTGGNALKFYASIRMDLRRSEAIKNGSEMIGNSVKVKVVKNKVAPPFRSCVIDIMYGKGVSKEGEIIDLGVQYEIIQKTGNWYEYQGEKMGNGREAAKAFLKDHPDVGYQLEEKIRAILQGKGAQGEVSPEE